MCTSNLLLRVLSTQRVSEPLRVLWGKGAAAALFARGRGLLLAHHYRTPPQFMTLFFFFHPTSADREFSSSFALVSKLRFGPPGVTPSLRHRLINPFSPPLLPAPAFPSQPPASQPPLPLPPHAILVSTSAAVSIVDSTGSSLLPLISRPAHFSHAHLRRIPAFPSSSPSSLPSSSSSSSSAPQRPVTSRTLSQWAAPRFTTVVPASAVPSWPPCSQTRASTRPLTW
jgi:hypothetical protein